MIVVIDNYDSFTFNLVQYLGIIGAEVTVHRNDSITVDTIRNYRPSGVLISPGPCTPNEAGISLKAVRELGGQIPILGVCLGHQSIGQAFGGEIVRAERIMHGKTSPIVHSNQGIFSEMPKGFLATRYHSLVIRQDSLPECLEVTATSGDDSEIMGIRHREYPIQGMQFHPESILTENGIQLLRTWLEGLN